MAGALPNGIRTSELKSRVLNLAQSSVYQIKLNPPVEVKGLLNARGFNFNLDTSNIELLCDSVALPGNSFQTTDVLNNYAGVTEKIVDRRDFGGGVQMSFYVDRNYKVLDFFEGWIDWMSNQLSNDGYKSQFAAYRMNYPVTYRGEVFITKFEKEAYGTSTGYTLVGAYPIAINNTPLSYGQSQIMKYNVTFEYLRYTRDQFKWKHRSNSLINNASRVTAEILSAFNSNPHLNQALRDDVTDEGNTRPGVVN